jgi:hypothetical protein
LNSPPPSPSSQALPLPTQPESCREHINQLHGASRFQAPFVTVSCIRWYAGVKRHFVPAAPRRASAFRSSCACFGDCKSPPGIVEYWITFMQRAMFFGCVELQAFNLNDVALMSSQKVDAGILELDLQTTTISLQVWLPFLSSKQTVSLLKANILLFAFALLFSYRFCSDWVLQRCCFTCNQQGCRSNVGAKSCQRF